MPCALSRLVPALFWLFHDLMLRHPHVSDPLNHTVIYPRVSRAPPHLIFDTLGDPLGKFFPPLSCCLVLDALSNPQLSRSVFAEMLFIPQIIYISHMTRGTPEPARSTTPTGGVEIQTQQTELNHEVTTNCIHITDKYRSGLIEKVPAILELQRAIPQDDKTTYLSVLMVYVKVLDGYKQICIPGGQEERDRDQAETAVPSRDVHEEDATQVTKRHRTPSSESDDDNSARCKISIWDLPWVTCNESSPLYLPPSLTVTQSILENIS